MADIVHMVRFGLPDDYWETYAAAVRDLTLAEIRAEADRVLQPDRLIWVVVGDRERIDESIRDRTSVPSASSTRTATPSRAETGVRISAPSARGTMPVER